MMVNDTQEKEKAIVFSVSEAKRLESGSGIVTGMITSLSTLFKVISKSEWECSNPQCNLVGSQKYNPQRLLPPKHLDNTMGGNVKCFKCNSTAFTIVHEYHNARTIQITDSDNKTENYDPLEVVLYDDAANNMIAGEIVDIKGDLYIQRNTNSSDSGKRLVNILHSNSIIYKHKEEVIITSKDIERLQRHKSICENAYRRELEAIKRNPDLKTKITPMRYLDRIVAMFAPTVIGYNDKKLGLLRSIVGGRSDHGNDNGRRGRINTLLVGDPGTAKSLLARESTRIVANSRYVTAPNASGKSLIAIVDKENDTLMCRYGVVVLAKGSVCSINEVGAMRPEEQQYLLDIAEEGRCTVDKYGTHFEIDAPTTIIATANPYNQTWNRAFNITKDEIPILKTLFDRCDQVYGFMDAPSEKEINEYAEQKTKIRKRRPHNYNFLRKLLAYAKTINPVMTTDAEERLNQFWKKAKVQEIATNRTYDSLFRMVEAQARLNLSNEVSDDIATQTMDSISLMLSQYCKIVETVQSPRDVTYTAFFNILKQTKSGLSITELCRVACEENKQIHEYLGDKWSIEYNHKLKPVIDMLLNHTNIRQIGQKPIVLQYIENCYAHFSLLSDATDVSDITEENRVHWSDTRSRADEVSDRSDRSDSRRTTELHTPTNLHQEPEKFEYDCYYCSNYQTNIEREYESHVVRKHPGKICYPGKADLERLAIEGQGKSWEK